MTTNPKEKTPIPALLSKQETAELIGGESLLSQLMRRRQIAFIKLGHRSIRFRSVDVEAALTRLTVKATT